MTIDDALRDTFGLAAFRPGQREVVECVLSGRPTVAVMPTGAGKSLCYQLPAVVAGGTALVVSPLIALMKDQVDALAARGVAAAAITSALGPAEQGARLDDLAEGRLRLAYVAPERWKSPRFLDALERAAPRLSLFAIDEAHCISEWGHDFRPDYLRLGEILARLRPPRIVALTATATPEVRRDIVRQLGLEDPVVFVRGFDRPNLRFAVERVGGMAEKTARLRAIVRERAGGAALVYAATRKNAEAYTEALRGGGVRALAYHAGLEDRVRADVQDAFMAGKVECVVATNAFGMGVDKPDVRLVVHADLPRSPEAYYQEAGRGGRDGDPADCVLLFQHGDVRLQEFLIEASNPSIEVLRGIWRLVREDPRRGMNVERLRSLLPGPPSEAALGAAVRYLVRAGWLRDDDGVLEAVLPGEGAPAPIDAAALAAREEIERAKLKAMVDYAYAVGCRRRFLLAWFGDQDARGLVHCGACDACAGAGRRMLDEEERSAARAACALVERLRGRFGRQRVAAILAATDDDEDGRFAGCPERGALRAFGGRWTLDLLRALEAAGYVVASPGEYPTIHVTPAGRRVAGGIEVPELALPPRSAAPRGRKRGAGASSAAAAAGRAGRAAAAEPAGPVDPEVLERLRRFRHEEAQRQALPAYCILSNKALEAIAATRPRDLGALAGVPGIGPAKLEKYGDAILALVSGPS